MSRDHEDLSRLLSGELPPDEAAALRARVAADPALRRAWERISGLPGALAALPLEAPPDTLRVASNTLPVASAPRRRPVFALASAAALAAAALLAVLTRAPPTVALDAGEIQTDGAALVHVPGGRVEADGKIRVTVEPPEGLRRGVGVEAPMKTHLLSAAAGAAITVAVLEGKARFVPERGEPVELSAGQTHHTGPSPAPAPEDRAGFQATPTDAAGRAALEDQVKALELQLAVARGQLAQVEGTQQPWPEKLAAALRPDAFEGTARGVATAVPGTRLIRVDCEEYPCVAFFESDDPTPGWGQKLSEAMQAAVGEDGGVWQTASIVDAGDGPRGLSGLAISPEAEADEARDIGRRLQTRVEPIMEELLEPAGAE